MNRPSESEYAPDYQGYVNQVSEADILPVLRAQMDDLDVLLERVGPDRETYAYAEGKWSIREIVGHLIDGERVFGYRAFCIARGEQQNLPGFDQDDYMLTAPYKHIELEDLLSELRHPSGNIAMFVPSINSRSHFKRTATRLNCGRSSLSCGCIAIT